MQQYLTIGAVGWEHPHWQDSYYPEELPEDWRLGYYSNEYHAVLLPQRDWFNSSVAQMQGWLQELSPDFRFFLALDMAAPELKALEVAATTLRELLAGIVLQGSRLHAKSIRPLSSTEMQGLLAIAPVYNDSEYKIGETSPGAVDCWRPGREIAAGSAMGILQGSELADLRGLRSLVQTFIQQAPQVRELFLFIEGEPPPAQMLRDAVTVAELLGY